MPGGDGTGPRGMGPMTGRAAGYCAGYPVPGFMNPVGGRLGMGFGRGVGGGRGRRNWFYATGLPGWARYGMMPAWGGQAPSGGFVPPIAAPVAPRASKKQQVDVLRGQAEYFEDVLDGIKEQIQKLETEAEE
ncbi:MAG: DUF5320 domain-containing protein [Planctomycetes bacterium]|nr:DUF5320 domain-containing protein [Planctomycetota bacterium]